MAGPGEQANPYKPKLIEVSIPLDDISRDCAINRSASAIRPRCTFGGPAAPSLLVAQFSSHS